MTEWVTNETASLNEHPPVVNTVDDIDLGELEWLLKDAGPGPWFLDGFILHDAGTWAIGYMERARNPSTKSDPKATARLAALAPRLAARVLADAAVLRDAREALEALGHAPKDYCQIAACPGCAAFAKLAATS